MLKASGIFVVLKTEYHVSASYVVPNASDEVEGEGKKLKSMHVPFCNNYVLICA